MKSTTLKLSRWKCSDLVNNWCTFIQVKSSHNSPTTHNHSLTTHRNSLTTLKYLLTTHNHSLTTHRNSLTTLKYSLTTHNHSLTSIKDSLTRIKDSLPTHKDSWASIQAWLIRLKASLMSVKAWFIRLRLSQREQKSWNERVSSQNLDFSEEWENWLAYQRRLGRGFLSDKSWNAYPRTYAKLLSVGCYLRSVTHHCHFHKRHQGEWRNLSRRSCRLVRIWIVLGWLEPNVRSAMAKASR